MERKYIKTYESFLESKKNDKFKEVEKKGEVTFYENEEGVLFQKSDTIGDIKVKDGKVSYKTIKKHNDCVIKYELNGANGFSIWCDDKNMEDNIWKIEDAEKVCDKLCKKNKVNEGMTAADLKENGKEVKKPVEGKEYRVIGFLSNTMAGAKFTVKEIKDDVCYFKGYKKGAPLSKLSFYEVEKNDKSVNESKDYTEKVTLSDGKEITIHISHGNNMCVLDCYDLSGDTKMKYAYWEDFDEEVLNSYIFYIENALEEGNVFYDDDIFSEDEDEDEDEDIFSEGVNLHPSWDKIKKKYGYDYEDKNKNYKVKVLKKDDCAKVKDFPNFHKTGSVLGMKERVYGKNALLVRCGDNIYNVTSEPKIYFEIAE